MFSPADPPDQPQIGGNLEGLRARRALRLVCSAFRGNPLADLTWYKNDQVSQYETVYIKPSTCNCMNGLLLSFYLNSASFYIKTSNYLIVNGQGFSPKQLLISP